MEANTEPDKITEVTDSESKPDVKDTAISNEITEFVGDFHNTYLINLDSTKDQYAIGFFMNEHLKLPGAYWCISALNLLNKLNDDRKDEMIKFINS